MKGRKSTDKARSITQRSVTPSRKSTNKSITQADKLNADFEDNILNISLKKPKRAYNYYINDMREKSKQTGPITRRTLAAL